MRRLRRYWWVAAIAVVLAGGACSAAPPPPVAAPSERATQPDPPASSDHALPSERPTRSEPPAEGPLSYVALGDSLASGMGGGRSYVDEYADLLEQERGVDVELTNLGFPGWTSTDLLQALQTDAQMRDAVATADLVTWDIGGNDLIEASVRIATQTCGPGDHRACLDRTYRQFARQWDAIVAVLLRLRRGPGVQLQTFDLYRPFATVRDVRTDATLATLERMNAHIRSTARTDDVTVAEVAGVFAQEEGLIAADGLHPSTAGHRAIAVQLLRAAARGK